MDEYNENTAKTNWKAKEDAFGKTHEIDINDIISHDHYENCIPLEQKHLFIPTDEAINRNLN